MVFWEVLVVPGMKVRFLEEEGGETGLCQVGLNVEGICFTIETVEKET